MFQCDGCMMRDTRIADRDAEIERLNAAYDKQHNLHMEIQQKMRGKLADRDAEIERLRADLVWAVRKGVMVGHDECVRPCIWFDVHRGVEYDGTPDSICRAVREARDGV